MFRPLSRLVCPRLAVSTLAALLALALMAAAAAASSPGGSFRPAEPVIPRPGPGESIGAHMPANPHLVQMRHIERMGRDGMPDILVLYPSIGRADVDTDIQRWIEHIVDTFEADFSRPPADVGRGSLAGGWLPDPANFSLSSTCHVTFPSANAVSVFFELWMYTGAEHPGLDVITLNYSLITGQRLELVDMFEDVDVALSRMSSLCREALSRGVGHGQVGRQILYGTEPVPENFASVELTSHGVRVHFQPYQVASWEAGAQDVDISLKDLAAARPLLDLWGRRTLVPALQPAESAPAPAGE